MPCILYQTQSIKIENINNTEDEEDESTPILSNAQALSAVNDLKRFIASFNESEDALQKLNYIENLIINNATKSLKMINRLLNHNIYVITFCILRNCRTLM